MDVDLGVLEPGDFLQAYNIMEESFPATELWPYEKAKELVEDPNYNVLLVKSPKGKVGGVLTFWNFPNFNFAEYFAIRRSMRGIGLGSAALTNFLRRNPKPLILEVEACDTTQAKRRIKFYERLGFVLTDINYLQPPVQAGDPPVPLTIMSYPEDIPCNKQKLVKDQIFKRVYGLSG